MKNILPLLIFFNTFICFAQSNKIEFKHNDQIVTGKLKTSLNNLQDYIVVKTHTNEELKFNIAKLKDVVINDKSFVAAKVLNDASLTKNINSLDYLPDPNYNENWLLLMPLVIGDYNLYQYTTNNFSQFYYQDRHTKAIKPLIYKQYTEGSYLKSNNRFRSQLRQELPLNYFAFKDYEKLDYSYDDLVRYFNKLNNYDENYGVDSMNLKLSVFAGYITNDLTGRPNSGDISIFGLGMHNYHMEKKSDITFGLSGEVFLDDKKLDALFLEAAFTKYSTSYYLDRYNKNISKVDFDFKTNILLFNLGYKRYFNISSNSQLYLSGSLSINFFNTSTNYANYHWFASGHNHNGEYIEVESDEVLVGRKRFTDLGGRIAFGYKFKKHYYVEANYRSALRAQNTGVIYKVTSFVAGYTF